MRLRARLLNPNTLLKTVQTVEKWSLTSGKVLIEWTPTRLHIIAVSVPHSSSSSAANIASLGFTERLLSSASAMPVFVHLLADVLLDNYVVESARQNKIMMDLSLPHLIKSLKTSMQSIETHIRLVKRNNLPTLVFDNTCENTSGKSVKMVQDVPCRLVRPQDAELVRVPEIDRLQTHIVLPPVVTLKTIVERLKSIGSSLILAANMEGKFNMCVETNTAQVRTFFKDLVNPPLDEDDLGAASQTTYYRRPVDQYSECVVDIKQFHKFLQCHYLNPRTIICCFYEDCGLVLHVYLGENGQRDEEPAGAGGIGVMTYYLHRLLE